MRRLGSTLVLVVVFLFGIRVILAEDIVYVREPGKKKDDTLLGTIDKESPSGIQLKSKLGKVRSIPALQIVQVEYGNPAVVRLDFRKPDSRLFKALEERRTEKKQEELRAALLGFQALDTGELSQIKPIHRYLQYRIAQTLSYLAREDVSRRDAAISALMDYKTNFADGWEIVPALQLLASMQEDKSDIEGASRTYADLAEIPGVSAAMKLQSQLRGARLLLRVSKFADAETKLKQVEAAMPADDPQRSFVEVYLLQSRIAQGGNLADVEKKLKARIEADKSDALRALAHNTLGDYYQHQKELDRAFWEYCKVDVMYNQDKEEQAKALYYLSKLFNIPRNNTERAKECLTRCLQSSQFDGTLYQRLAAAEKKKE